MGKNNNKIFILLLKTFKNLKGIFLSIAYKIPPFFSFLHFYIKDKLFILLNFIEDNKNIVVKTVLIKRGKRNRIFLHLSAMMLLTFGIIVSPFISDSNLFSENKMLSFAQESSREDSIASADVFQTEDSVKPRDKTVSYTVQKGDTISTIAKRFGISEDTVRWSNDLKNDNITIGDILQILPVTGISHKVARGESVYTIAKKYTANPQEIVDFPFNDFANPQTFSLIEGQMLIVPNGVKPEEKPVYVRPAYIATGPVTVSPGGFSWPLTGGISQFYSWYHKGIDITASVSSPVVAAQNGRVVQAYSSGWNWGYGIHVVIDGDNGYSTLYAHMSGINVNVGDQVNAGSTVIGWVGTSGRTTGPHLHFEIKTGSNYLNPYSVLH